MHYVIEWAICGHILSPILETKILVPVISQVSISDIKLFEFV